MKNMKQNVTVKTPPLFSLAFVSNETPRH